MLLQCKVFLELAKHCEPCSSFRKGCAPMCEHTWANAMFKHVRTFVIRTKPWTRTPRKRRTRNRSEMLTLTTWNGEVSFDVVVDAGKMQQCLRDSCRLNKCFKPSSNHKPDIFQSHVRTYLQKNDKAVNVNQLVSHVPDYHNKSSLNAFINDIKTKCIRMYNYV